MEPYFYKAALHIQAFNKGNQKSDKAKLEDCLDDALKYLEKALELNENCSNLYYVKALIIYALGELEIAHSYIEKAIEKADENYAKYYFLKGAIFGASGNYSHAISDLSIAISLDKNYRLAYLERGKCYFGLCDLKQAFLDIQQYTSVKGNDPNIHLWAGNLLFSTGAYEDAARAYSNSESINKSEKLLCLRAKCYLTVKELNLALSDLNKLVDLQTLNNIHYLIDRECLYSLKTASTTEKGSEELDQISLVRAIQSISKIVSYKMSGKIFSLEDLYFYKSVFHFYLQEYEQALDDLDTAWDFHVDETTSQRAHKKQGNGQSGDHIKVAENQGASDQNSDIEEKRSASNRNEYLYNRAMYLLKVEIISIWLSNYYS